MNPTASSVTHVFNSLKPKDCFGITRFDIKILYLPLARFIYGLCTDLIINGDYFPTKQFVTETECVYCAALTVALTYNTG